MARENKKEIAFTPDEQLWVPVFLALFALNVVVSWCIGESSFGTCPPACLLSIFPHPFYPTVGWALAGSFTGRSGSFTDLGGFSYFLVSNALCTVASSREVSPDLLRSRVPQLQLVVTPVNTWCAARTPTQSPVLG
jgi:hypothetical protein